MQQEYNHVPVGDCDEPTLDWRVQECLDNCFVLIEKHMKTSLCCRAICMMAMRTLAWTLATFASLSSLALRSSLCRLFEALACCSESLQSFGYDVLDLGRYFVSLLLCQLCYLPDVGQPFSVRTCCSRMASSPFLPDRFQLPSVRPWQWTPLG